MRLAVEVELQHEVGGELVDRLVDAKLLEGLGLGLGLGLGVRGWLCLPRSPQSTCTSASCGSGCHARTASTTAQGQARTCE